jgi:hypothetical protein
MKTLGTDVATSTPDQFSAFVKAEVAKWGEAIKRSGVSVD